MTKLLDAGHIYTMNRYGDREIEEGFCRHAVTNEGGWFGWHQCRRRIKVEREVDHNGTVETLGYCSIHDPVFVAEKNRKANEKYEARREAFRRERDMRVLGEKAIAALKVIAGGHNDPRGLARAALEGMEE